MLDDYRGSLLGNENVLETDSGDGCMTLRMPLDYAIKVVKVANVMLCLPHHDFLKNSQSGPKKIMKVSWEGLKKLLW